MSMCNGPTHERALLLAHRLSSLVGSLLLSMLISDQPSAGHTGV